MPNYFDSRKDESLSMQSMGLRPPPRVLQHRPRRVALRSRLDVTWDRAGFSVGRQQRPLQASLGTTAGQRVKHHMSCALFWHGMLPPCAAAGSGIAQRSMPFDSVHPGAIPAGVPPPPPPQHDPQRSGRASCVLFLCLGHGIGSSSVVDRISARQQCDGDDRDGYH